MLRDLFEIFKIEFEPSKCAFARANLKSNQIHLDLKKNAFNQQEIRPLKIMKKGE